MMIIDPRWGEDLTTPDLLREVAERIGDMDEDSAEQVLFLSQVLPKVMLRNSEDLLAIGPERLTRAWELFDEGLI